MECLGPQCATMLLEWIKAQAAGSELGGRGAAPITEARPHQGLLWKAAPYLEEAPAITTPAELAGAIEHLQYAVHRRYQNQLTRAERARLDNSIDNALFKVDRYLLRLDPEATAQHEGEVRELREAIREGRERIEHQYRQARRADLKLAQLSSLTPESFEEFVAELFEALGYVVETVGGSGDEGADLRLRRGDGLLAVVQCKYHKKGVVGSPVLQKFLGTIHHTLSHKGYFVTTSTFSLSAEKFAAEHPIELVDGPRLIELVNQALGHKGRRETEPVWF
jgi:restriction system protein